MPRTFQRSFTLTLALGMLITAALACNFPGASQSANQTLTADANLAATAAANAALTVTAQANALSMTQTALVPTNTIAATSSAGTSPATVPATAPPLPAGVTPTQTSIALGSLKVGVEALVSTTAGSTLYLRDAPAKSGKIIAQMPSDTRVKIVDGPQAADGWLWWNVQVLTSGSTTAIGKTGWCSEFDGKVQTLTAAK